MKTLTINGTTLNVLVAYPYQYPSGKRELRITLPQEAIAYADLKELLKAHDGDIVLTKEDGTTETFVGYRTTASITDKVENETEVFYVVLDCVGEAERKALEAEARAKALEATVAQQGEIITAQASEVAMLNEQLLVVQMAAAELYEMNRPVETEPVESEA